MTTKLMLLAAGPEQVPLIMAAKQCGVYTIVVDEDPTRPGMRLADKPVVLSILNETRCVELARIERIDGVATTALSLGIRTLGAIAEELGLPGLRRWSAYLTTDKIAMRQRLAEVGLPSPAFRVATDIPSALQAIEDLSLPVIFKPPDGSGSRGVRWVQSVAEVPTAYQAAVAAVRSPERVGQVLVEKFVEGRDFGSEGFLIGETLRIVSIREMMLTPYPYRQEIGYLYPTRLALQEVERIHNYLRAAALALGLRDTAFHADFKVDKTGQPVLIEMGARLPGYGLAVDFIPHATGIDLFRGLIDIALGRPLNLPEPKQNPTVMLFFQFKPGKLKTEINLDDVLEKPGIVCVRCNLKPGDTILPITDGSSAIRNGYVVTTGKTVAEAEYRAQEVVANLHVEIE